MTNAPTASRRNFLKGGALLAAPVAAASVCAVALADDGLQDRITRLEDEAALRRLHHSWLCEVNAGEHGARPDRAVRRVTAHHAGAPDRFDIAADGRSAVGHFDLAVELENTLPQDSTLAQMAHVQGSGTLRSTERRMLRVDYIKIAGVWKIAKVAMPNAD